MCLLFWELRDKAKARQAAQGWSSSVLNISRDGDPHLQWALLLAFDHPQEEEFLSNI